MRFLLSTGQFHLRFMRAFFVHKSFLQLFISLVTFGFVIFGAKILFEKRACKTLMKLTSLKPSLNDLLYCIIIYLLITYQHTIYNILKNIFFYYLQCSFN